MKDAADFIAAGNWRPLSYLMPVYFQYWGDNGGKREVLSAMRGFEDSLIIKVRTHAAEPDWDVVVDNFVPNVTRIGTPAGKVFIADGTRFVTESGRVDHDVSPYPNWFGSFTSAGAWRSAGQAYGVKERTNNWDGRNVGGLGSEGKGRNLFYSYRHGKRDKIDGSCWNNRGKIGAAFFDGHVEVLSDRESRRIDLWYPKGAWLRFPAGGMIDLPMGYKIR